MFLDQNNNKGFFDIKLLITVTVIRNERGDKDEGKPDKVFLSKDTENPDKKASLYIREQKLETVQYSKALCNICGFRYILPNAFCSKEHERLPISLYILLRHYLYSLWHLFTLAST